MTGEGQARAFSWTIWAIAGGITAFATAQGVWALSIGSAKHF